MSRPKITVVGSSNTDLVVNAPRIPKAGETVLGSAFLIAAGGKGANQAVAAARLGADVTLVARIGTDAFGKEALKRCKRERIKTEFLVQDDATPSGVALIVVDRLGENAIAVAPGANRQLSITDVERAKATIQNADVLLLQLETPIDAVQHAAALAADAGVRVILNPAPNTLLSPWGVRAHCSSRNDRLNKFRHPRSRPSTRLPPVMLSTERSPTPWEKGTACRTPHDSPRSRGHSPSPVVARSPRFPRKRKSTPSSRPLDVER